VRIRGARIDGVLDLTDCSGPAGDGLPALALLDCEIPELIDLSHARLARLSLQGSRLTRLVAVEAQVDGEIDLSATAPLGAHGHETLTARLRGIRVDGDLMARGAKFARATDSNDHALTLKSADIHGSVLLDEGFEAFGCVRLSSIRIGGRLQCRGGHFLNRSDDAKRHAISAETAHIGGIVALGDGFKAEGAVIFTGARIDADVDLAGGSIRNEQGAALVLANANVGGQVGGPVKIAGQLQLQGATIARNLLLVGAEIAHPVSLRGDRYGRAVDAAGISVGGSALFQGANIKGEVFLADARIGGYLAFGGGRFIHGGDWAIRAPNARVGGNLTFKMPNDGFAPHGQKTLIEGAAKFDRAQVGGMMAWSALELRGPGPDGAKGGILSFADARIAGPLQARNLMLQQEARVDASGASCAALDDDLKNGWGAAAAALDLEGFIYGRLENAAERWRQRLAWLRRVRRDHFSSQPYAHLAQVYARAGRREDARRILLAQHDARTLRASPGPFAWTLSSLFGLIAGYGLAPLRIVRALVLFLALGVAGVLAMNAQGALVTPQGRACNGAVEPALYALDVALPVIDLGQESRCAPGRTVRAELPQGIVVSETSDWRLFEGVALWRWAHALYAMFGAILTALAIVTFSGIMKPKDE
jgi:hypothetical protein